MNLSLFLWPEFTGKYASLTRKRKRKKKQANRPSVCDQKTDSILNVKRSREGKAIPSEMKNNFLKHKQRPYAPPPPPLLAPCLLSFFIIDTSLLFDLCTPLFQLPRCQGKMASSEIFSFPASLGSQPLWLSQLDHTELVKYFIINPLCTFCSR